VQITDNMPVLVAASQVVDRLGPQNRRLDPVALAAEAVQESLKSLGVPNVERHVDQVMVMRTFVDSVPDRIKPLLAPFGFSDQFARSVANEANLEHVHARYATAGGQSPQQYTAKACSAIARGDAQMVVLCGAEAIGTMRAHQRSGEALDWSASPVGESSDDGMGLEDQFVPALAAHKVIAPIDIYPLIEHRKRNSRGLSRANYRSYLGRVLAPLAEVARVNPFAMFERVPPASEITELSERNRAVGDPHLKSMVAKDGVNQSAALVVMSYGLAAALGLQERAVFLRGFAEATERALLEREDLSTSPALRWSYAKALERAGLEAADIDAFDLYSCFPVAVIEAMEALGIDVDDHRPTSLTGGLPFFGGPGNNYSMHGIASAVTSVQSGRYSDVLVGALGGHLSKHAVGVYSRSPGVADPLSHELDFKEGGNSIALASEFSGAAVIETFVVKSIPEGQWLAVLAINDAGQRVVAGALIEQGDLANLFVEGEPIGERVLIEPSGENTHQVVGIA
jgi:acetyl-CoA C-acetyltransferase